MSRRDEEVDAPTSATLCIIGSVAWEDPRSHPSCGLRERVLFRHWARSLQECSTVGGREDPGTSASGEIERSKDAG
jgi:hypothetical protein